MTFALLVLTNQVFEIIAAVPMLDEEEYGEVRRYYEQEQGLDEIDNRGFRIKEATHRIWKGERDLNTLTKGLEADSALIIQRILLHTLSIEQKVGQLLEEEAAAKAAIDDANEKAT